MRYKKAELAFAKNHGARFERALTAATIAARQDSRLVGLDKIREPLAWHAALKAIGYEDNGVPLTGFAVPPSAGTVTTEIQEVADSVFAAAAAAAELTT